MRKQNPNRKLLGIPMFFEKYRLEIVAANNAGLAAKIARRPIIL
tara:strand:+ start:1308 stop:1439 length:132 start_codon:yes stop_codon:yes gene_type:complete